MSDLLHPYSLPREAALGDLRRLSLRSQAERLGFQLGALQRRLEHEMPRAATELEDALATLRRVVERCSEPLAGAPRQGELF